MNEVSQSVRWSAHYPYPLPSLTWMNSLTCRLFVPNSFNTPCVPWRRCCPCVTSGTPYTKGGFVRVQYVIRKGIVLRALKIKHAREVTIHHSKYTGNRTHHTRKFTQGSCLSCLDIHIYNAIIWARFGQIIPRPSSLLLILGTFLGNLIIIPTALPYDFWTILAFSPLAFE